MGKRDPQGFQDMKTIKKSLYQTILSNHQLCTQADERLAMPSHHMEFCCDNNPSNYLLGISFQCFKNFLRQGLKLLVTWRVLLDVVLVW